MQGPSHASKLPPSSQEAQLQAGRHAKHIVDDGQFKLVVAGSSVESSAKLGPPSAICRLAQAAH